MGLQYMEVRIWVFLGTLLLETIFCQEILTSDFVFVDIHDALVPSGAVPSIVHDGKKLMGRSAFMYSYPAAEDMYISSSLQNGQWFDEIWEFLCRLFHYYGKFGQMNFLDIGANIGSIAVPMALCLSRRPGPTAASEIGKVIAVEPVPEHIGMLRANLRVNFIENAMVWPYAVGSKGYQSSITLLVNASNKGHATILHNTDVDEDGYSVTVPLSTIDELYRAAKFEMSRVLVMKIDIEGAEGHALYGANLFFTEVPPCFLRIELAFHYLVWAGTPVRSLMDYLNVKGYDTEKMCQRGVDMVFQQRDLFACIERISRSLDFL